jgi:hypothetical protein
MLPVAIRDVWISEKALYRSEAQAATLSNVDVQVTHLVNHALAANLLGSHDVPLECALKRLLGWSQAPQAAPCLDTAHYALGILVAVYGWPASDCLKPSKPLEPMSVIRFEQSHDVGLYGGPIPLTESDAGLFVSD